MPELGEPAQSHDNQEIGKHFGKILHGQMQAVGSLIGGSRDYKTLLEKASNSHGQVGKNYGESNDVDIDDDYTKGSLVVDPAGHYYFYFETPSIIQGNWARAGLEMDEYGQANVRFEHLIETTEIEKSLGINVGEVGVDKIIIQNFINESLDNFIHENLSSELSETLTNTETHYYVDEDGEIKKVISFPVPTYEQASYYKELEKKLTASNIAFCKLSEYEYCVPSKAEPEDFEMLGIALNALQRRVQDITNAGSFVEQPQ